MNFQRYLHFLCTVTISAIMLCLYCGCSTGKNYWANRADDAKDVVGISLGFGVGAKVQAGPISIGPMYNYTPKSGLQGGEFIVEKKHDETFHVDEGNASVVSNEKMYQN